VNRLRADLRSPFHSCCCPFMSLAGLIIASDYTRHDLGDPFPARGSEDVKRIVKMLRAMFPDFMIDYRGDCGRRRHRR